MVKVLLDSGEIEILITNLVKIVVQDNWQRKHDALLEKKSPVFIRDLLFLVIKMFFLKRIDDSHKVAGFERCAANQSTVNVGIGKQFFGVGWVAASTIQNGCIVG